MPERTTLSFYRYTPIQTPEQLRAQFRQDWASLDVKGRIYLSHEGINAQVSVPTSQLTAFKASVEAVFPGMPYKEALEERSDSFRKLQIKVREKIVADGLPDNAYDLSETGQHLNAWEFNKAMADPKTLVVDMRNHYECEVGHFEGAYLPQANTFREALPEVRNYLEGRQDHKILLYCTGGIRCEKASAWLKRQGFQDVNQLNGGIVNYARQIKQKDLPSRFKGVNFVFDDRLSERVTDDVIAQCHQCGTTCDRHVNCRFPGCNRLFLQCPQCEHAFAGCCSDECRTINQQPRDEQIRIQNQWEAQSPKFLRSRQRLLRKPETSAQSVTANAD
jgi:UPF0176 protein